MTKQRIAYVIPSSRDDTVDFVSMSKIELPLNGHSELPPSLKNHPSVVTQLMELNQIVKTAQKAS